MTAAGFAQRCAQLGAEAITTNVVANIETRRREISVNELMVFALVLDVAPVHLLTPITDTAGTNAGEAEAVRTRALALTSSVQVEDPLLAARWIRGEQALPGGQDRLYYETSLDTPQAGEADQTLSQYARAVLQDGAKRLATQYEAQATSFQNGVREQVTELLSGLEEAVTQATSPSDVRDVLEEARTRLSTTAPTEATATTT